MISNRKTAIVFLGLVLFSVSCEQHESPSGNPPIDTSSTARSQRGTVSFLHLNDTYRVGNVEEGLRGGFGRVATTARDLELQGHHVVITHAGDLLFPSLESQLWGGAQMIEALNYLAAIAPLYLTPGNHEFDERTPIAASNAIKASEFTWLADNLRLNTGDPNIDALLQRAQIIEAGGHKIGIFGLTLLPRDGGNERDYAPVEGEYLETAKAVLKVLEAQGADMIIGLTHLHLGDDREIAKLKAEHPTFLAILGGHEHEPEYEAESADSAAIYKGASNARTIWRLDLDFTGSAPAVHGQMLEMNTAVAIDEGYQLIADRWQKRLLDKIPFLQGRIGQAALPLDGREVAIRSEETSWGNFIADQMPLAFGEPAADFAFVNAGTLRLDDFVAEDITFEDVGRTFGFSSYLRYMTISGADFVELLEAGYRGIGPSKGYFPQIAGFRVCVDRSRDDGERIVQLQRPTEAGWVDIDRSADYTLVAPDFLYRGGDGYDFAKARQVSRPGSELKYLLLDAIITTQATGKLVGKAVDPEQPRIAFARTANEACFVK